MFFNNQSTLKSQAGYSSYVWLCCLLPSVLTAALKLSLCLSVAVSLSVPPPPACLSPPTSPPACLPACLPPPPPQTSKQTRSCVQVVHLLNPTRQTHTEKKSRNRVITYMLFSGMVWLFQSHNTYVFSTLMHRNDRNDNRTLFFSLFFSSPSSSFFFFFFFLIIQKAAKVFRAIGYFGATCRRPLKVPELKGEATLAAMFW